jgi:hypothetical protein
MLFKFFRGQQAAVIHSVFFSTDGDNLVVANGKGTVHVFSCSHAAASTASAAVWGNRSFATVHLPEMGCGRLVCALSRRILSVVITHDSERVVLVQYEIGKQTHVLREFTLA